MAGDPPLNFIATGGEPVGSEDVGYGPARILLPDQVAELDSALANFSDHEFARRFDLEALSNEAIYPDIWDEPARGSARRIPRLSGGRQSTHRPGKPRWASDHHHDTLTPLENAILEFRSESLHLRNSEFRS